MQPFCVKCRVFMRCEKNSCQLLVAFEEWRACDRYVCEECGADVLTGMASTPQVLSDREISSMLGRGDQFYQDKAMGPAPRLDLRPSDRMTEAPGPF